MGSGLMNYKELIHFIRRGIVWIAIILYLGLFIYQGALSRKLQLTLMLIIMTNQSFEHWIWYKEDNKKYHLFITYGTIALWVLIIGLAIKKYLL